MFYEICESICCETFHAVYYFLLFLAWVKILPIFHFTMLAGLHAEVGKQIFFADLLFIYMSVAHISGERVILVQACYISLFKIIYITILFPFESLKFPFNSNNNYWNNFHFCTTCSCL